MTRERESGMAERSLGVGIVLHFLPRFLVANIIFAHRDAGFQQFHPQEQILDGSLECLDFSVHGIVLCCCVLEPTLCQASLVFIGGRVN